MKKTLILLLVTSALMSPTYADVSKLEDSEVTGALALPEAKAKTRGLRTRGLSNEAPAPATMTIRGVLLETRGPKVDKGRATDVSEASPQSQGHLHQDETAEIEEVEVYKDLKLELPVLFERNRALIDSSSANSQTNLSLIADSLKADENLVILLVGETCDRGEADYNDVLSWRRANAVRDELVSPRYGISPQRILVIGQGEANVPDSIRNLKEISENEPQRAPYRRVMVRRVSSPITEENQLP